MGRWIILTLILFVLLGAGGILLVAGAARCVGATPCNARSTCSSCQYCAKNGGTCAVCAAGIGGAHGPLSEGLHLKWSIRGCQNESAEPQRTEHSGPTTKGRTMDKLIDLERSEGWNPEGDRAKEEGLL
jgi:hypothetical protein